ncbi:sensor histidine kinase [Microbacterium sp. cx-59]|uniref:sensor histidine kinase n=1 Tax=Microbacterium sp. cx-59 TaxID=2891207 RepID=UPI001E283BD5|nr:histidine kinase [Microbacterium sp. cx-59]MCC4907525.1 histidine kinase [Microbacterium sp. cx-59]
MTSPIPARSDAPRIGERALARSVTATWWYTVGGIVFFGVVATLQWLVWILVRHDEGAGLSWRLALAGISLIVVHAGVVFLLRGYRPVVLAGGDEERGRLPRPDAIALVGVVMGGVLLGLAAGSWMAGASIFAYALSVRPWLPGIRWRVILAVTVALVAVWVAEASWSDLSHVEPNGFFVPALFATMLPVIAASSLWWWDIVLELDRARQAESLLAATRERLRLANDVHDLQGHHLQVIALQLELAQRLIDRDPEAAAAEITRAQAAVDAARQGTRDLAAAFRGVPLPDELANAVDLLRSAGVDVHPEVDAAAVDAPADVLGPIVRESVTNVLKHGSGRWARLSLERDAAQWVYRIANDETGEDETGDGSGLAGMTERANAVGGDIRVGRSADTFELTVSLPAAPTERDST